MTFRLLRLPAVMAMTGMGRDSIYRLAREGRFPRPVKLTERSSAWREDQLLDWIESRPTAQLGATSKSPSVGSLSVVADDTQSSPGTRLTRSGTNKRRMQ